MTLTYTTTFHSTDGTAEDFQAQAGESVFTLDEIVRLCGNESWTATLYNDAGFEVGHVDAEGGYRLY